MIFHCPHCGLKAAPGRSNCQACGRTMTRTCPECRESVAVDAKACKYCGADAPPAAAAAASGPAPVPKRRRSRIALLFLLILLGAAGGVFYKGLKERAARAGPVPVRSY
jgi:hypothetical protein